MRIRFKFTLSFIFLSLFPLVVAGIFAFQKLSKTDILFIGFIALLAAVISFLVARIFFRPISELANMASRFQEGNFSQKINVQSKDEIGKISQIFNNLGKQLQELSLNFEQKVEERTVELKGKIKDLENTKRAILNLLEDLEIIKNKLETARAKDEAILVNIGEGLIFTDLEKRILLINKAGEDILDWEEKELLDKTWTEVVGIKNENAEEISSDLFSLDKIIDSPFIFTNDYYYTKKNGKIFPVAITASKVSVNNEPIGIIIVFRDITREKEIDKAKTEFVSLASHQLRTPLSTINWYTEMLLAEDAGEINKEQKKYLEEIYQGSKRMVGLVNALLNVSRIELGTFAIEPEPVDLKNVAQIVLKELEPKIKNKKIKIHSSFDSNLPIIQLDPRLVNIIFQNLLSNAVKYTPSEGEVSLTVTIKDKDVIIKVTDTGYGIPLNQQDKIFSKLFRADNVVSKDTEGTGLGLYIVKSIIDHFNGRIWFESEENKGTTFCATLPLGGVKRKEGTKTLG